MQRLFSMSIFVTAGRFDTAGALIPTRILYDGSEHTVHESTCGRQLSFRHNGYYFWIERGAKGWGITRCIR